MEVIAVAPAVLAAIRAHADAALPEECCGLLLGAPGAVGTALRAGNIHPSPRTRFEIDPQVLVDAHRAARAGGPQVVGYYHSHPQGAAAPSATDRAEASGDGRIWAIASRDAITFWRDEPGGFTPLAVA